MNGAQKFHKPNGPAFNIGEKWIAASGGFPCWITGVEKFGEGEFDYRISYKYADGRTSSKDAWPFQVRYYHNADKNL